MPFYEKEYVNFESIKCCYNCKQFTVLEEKKTPTTIKYYYCKKKNAVLRIAGEGNKENSGSLLETYCDHFLWNAEVVSTTTCKEEK